MDARMHRAGRPCVDSSYMVTPTYGLWSLRLRPWLVMSATLCLVGAMAFPPSSVAAAAPTAAGPSQKWIVILHDQNAGLPANSAARLAAVRAAQAPIIAQLRLSGARVVASTYLVNAIVVVMSPREATSLAANPAVAEVVPDGVIAGPSQLAAPPLAAAGSPALKPSTTSASSCGTSAAPELDPEALFNINAVQAQSLGFNGVGVTVAFLADGVDPTNADFQRNRAYASAGSAAGSPVITKYADFSGEGTSAATGGGEAFVDASSIAAQGNGAYDLSTFVNPAHPLPAGCDIKIVGVAPGANVLALKVFAQNDNTTTSGFLQAIDYAVSSGAKVINESFGSDNFPDTTLDVVRAADDAAVAAGVTVVVGSGDAGITSTIGSPATDPNVISVGATTTFHAYAQDTYGGFNDPHSNGRFVDNNISALSSGGFTQAGSTLDLVAPGDLNWALCSTDTANYADCTDEQGQPSPIELSGGTSESAPLTAGAAADVIQAYASTHGGVDPSPALVKQILMSTATDLDAPAAEQGAGLLNVLAAVKEARSIAGTTVKPNGGLLIGPDQINVVQQPGATTTQAIKLTNTGSSPVRVALSTRALTHQVADQTGSFCMQPGTPTGSCPANTGSFLIWSGVNEVYQEQTFTVPRSAGPSRLEFIADYPFTGQNSLLHFALLEPNGTYAGYSLPQGPGAFGRVEVADPPAGTWTAVFFTEQNDATPGGVGTSGTVEWDASTLAYRPAGSVSPASITIGAGHAVTAHLRITSPSAAGDADQSVVVSTSGGQTTIPVTVRTVVPMTANGGTFDGVVTGGNGRGVPAQSNVYSFDVPAGKTDLDVSVALATDPGDMLIATLVDPQGHTVGYSTNFTIDELGNPIATPDVSLYHVAPVAGRWRLILEWTNPVSGAELNEPFTGAIRFNQVTVSSNLPNSPSAMLPRGAIDSFTLTVTNTGLAPEAFFVDPRLDQPATISLPDQNGSASNMTLPLKAGLSFPYYLVPTHTSQVEASLTGSVPVTFDLEYFPGDPDVSPTVAAPRVSGSSSGNSASLTLRESDVSPGLWLLNPDQLGPYPPAGAPTATASASLTAITDAFDPTVASSTGDFWSAANGLTTFFSPVYVAPGGTTTITISVTPQAALGTQVSGTLYLDDYALGSTIGAILPNADELAAIPYSYTVRQ